MQSLWKAKSKAMAFSGIPGQSLPNKPQIYKFTSLHCHVLFVEQVWVLRIQSRVRFVETFVSSDLHCRGVLVAVQRRWQLFHTRSCHLGPGQSDVGHSLGHHHPSVGHRCLFFSKLLPLGDQALSAAIMFCQPLWSVRSISSQKIFFSAQRSLLLLLASIFLGQ